MKDTSLHEIDPRVVVQFRAAQSLGEMVADRTMSKADARETLAVVADVAAEKLPHMDRRGLQTRLAHHMADSGNVRFWDRKREELAAIRQEKRQLNELKWIAEQAFRAGEPEAAVRRRISQAAQSMTPVPPVALGNEALGLGRWLARQGNGH